jgi:hypothetical protein
MIPGADKLYTTMKLLNNFMVLSVGTLSADLSAIRIQLILASLNC